MARLMGRRMLAPINSVKHYVGQPKFNIALGASTTLLVANPVAAPVDTNREKISEGSVIKAIYHEWWLSGDGASGTNTEFVMTVEKSPSSSPNPVFSDMLNLGGYANKKNILYTTQGLLGAAVDGPAIPILRTWIKIPKGKQRMGQEDRMIITFATVDTGINVCGFSTYKEYT